MSNVGGWLRNTLDISSKELIKTKIDNWVLILMYAKRAPMPCYPFSVPSFLAAFFFLLYVTLATCVLHSLCTFAEFRTWRS